MLESEIGQSEHVAYPQPEEHRKNAREGGRRIRVRDACSGHANLFFQMHLGIFVSLEVCLSLLYTMYRIDETEE
jgi:hypothetical protein